MMRLNFLCLMFFFSPVMALCQQNVTLSGNVKERRSKGALAYVSVALKKATDSSLVVGSITSEEGLFSLPNGSTGNCVALNSGFHERTRSH
jgi:hypothetical protein